MLANAEMPPWIQLGVGVKGGIGKLVLVSLRNAHNCFSRDACLRAYGRSPALARYVPYIHSRLAPEARVRAGLDWLEAR